jgi:tetratricopeptide (TPR) repeat protein
LQVKKSLLLLLLLNAFFSCGCRQEQDASTLLLQASQAMHEGRYADAEQLATQVIERDAYVGEAYLLAGDAAAELGDFERAIASFSSVPATDPKHKAQGHCRAARIEVKKLKRLQEGEKHFRLALQAQPNSADALDGLSYVLSLSGQRWESADYFIRLIQTNKFETGHLLGVAILEYLLGGRDVLQELHQANPNDPLPMMGLARLAIEDSQPNEARELLSKAVQLDPSRLEAQAWLGHVLLDDSDVEGLKKWRAQLPEGADAHPEIWTVQARWAQRIGDNRGAIRCYVEALRRDANHIKAATTVPMLLHGMREHALAEPFAERSLNLIRFHESAARVRSDLERLSFQEETALAAESLGRLWEALGWYRQVLTKNPHDGSARKAYTRLKDQLTPDIPQTISTANPALAFDVSEWPLPEWFSDKVPLPVEVAPPSIAESKVRFEDLAQQVGIDFQYVNGSDPNRQGTRIYEVDGGGIGILDYDADGWPDIYLTQGTAWPPDPHQDRYFDRLYRNLGDGHFTDVTVQAGLRANGFGQGIAIGDYNNDGLPDIFVGNLGANQLYRNRGDGTFEDVTLPAGINSTVWTSSAAIADLNGDTYPDIYEVNYLRDEERMFDRVCPDKAGHVRICPPLSFDAEQDRLYLSLGDGTFRECGEEVGIHAGDGKGLGIVIADFDHSGRLSVFIGNDVVENFYFYNDTVERGGELKLANQAVLHGLAFSDDGHAQACMGVAAGDANGDGLLDMFVANFYREPNCLYLQQQDGSFLDTSRVANLRHNSFSMLGFGTQFLDGESDGNLDLVVTNGHLTDERDIGVPYQMPPQYFRNLGNAHFAEVTSDSLGSFFDQAQLGRGLALIDWNRDGRNDFAVTFLDRPAALVTNQTEDAGHFLALQLRGITSDRDAIGTKVTVKAGDVTHRTQLIAGDGYQVSCQRQLLLGLGPNDRIDRLEVTWPGGAQQSWEDLAADQELILIEGAADPVALPN